MTFILVRVCLLELNASFYRQIIIRNSSKHESNTFSRHVSVLRSLILTPEVTNLDRSAHSHCHYVADHTRGSTIFKASTLLPRRSQNLKSSSCCFEAPSHFVSNESSVLLALGCKCAPILQSLQQAGGVFVAAELLPRFVPCAIHFETRLCIETFRMFYDFGSASFICWPVVATDRAAIYIL